MPLEFFATFPAQLFPTLASEWVSEWSSTDLRIGNWTSSDSEVVSTHHKQDVLEIIIIIIIISWKVRQLLITAAYWEKWRERVIARNWNVCEMQIKWLVTITQCMSLLRLNSTSNWLWRARPLNMGNDLARSCGDDATSFSVKLTKNIETLTSRSRSRLSSTW